MTRLHVWPPQAVSARTFDFELCRGVLSATLKRPVADLLADLLKVWPANADFTIILACTLPVRSRFSSRP